MFVNDVIIFIVILIFRQVHTWFLLLYSLVLGFTFLNRSFFFTTTFKTIFWSFWPIAQTGVLIYTIKQDFTHQVLDRQNEIQSGT